jgi:hypothetical protein
MEGYCSTGQSPQWVVVPMEEEVWDPIVCALAECSGTVLIFGLMVFQ